MSLKQRLKGQIKRSRGYSEELLAAFETPEQWTHQVHENANHALWFAGHMGVVDDFMISVVDRSQVAGKEGYQEKFGMGSQPVSDPGQYPSPDEVLDYMRDRRKTLLSVLDALSEEDLLKPAPEGTPDFLTDIASVFELAAWHEGLHSGQVSVARKALGNAPVHG